MRMHYHIQPFRFAVLLILSGLAGCQEIYEPELEVTREHLVVEGVITDQSGPHAVYLSYTGKYGEARHRRPANRATVVISDSDGRETPLHEHWNGQYLTPQGFSAEVGKSYTLHIMLSNGEEYRSSPQKVKPPVRLSNVEAEVGSDFQYFESGVSDRLYQREFIGKHVYVETETEKGKPSLFRFNTRLLLQYTASVDLGPINPPAIEYCWEYRDVTNLVGRDISRPESNRIRTAFIPRQPEYMQYYNFPSRRYATPRVVVMELFALNPESHLFYREKYNQLSDEGHIFDPIAAQLPSNIECVSDPDNQAFGLFEASSVSKRGFRVIMNYREGSADILPWMEVENISDQGCLLEEKPPFWIGK